MTDNNQSLTNPDLWIRLVYMVIFWLLSYIARMVIGAVGFIQFFVVLFSGETNKNLKNLGEGTARWTQQNYLFLSFASEQKPYPFQDWPSPEGDQTSDDDSGTETPAGNVVSPSVADSSKTATASATDASKPSGSGETEQASDQAPDTSSADQDTKDK
jgi:hypothetical protein